MNIVYYGVMPNNSVGDFLIKRNIRLLDISFEKLDNDQ